MPDLPLTASEVLERTFLETRCKILEIAANLDRMDRARERHTIMNSQQVSKIRTALSILQQELGTATGRTDRAEQIQMLFSRQYDQHWPTEFGLEAITQEDG